MELLASVSFGLGWSQTLTTSFFWSSLSLQEDPGSFKAGAESHSDVAPYATGLHGLV